MIFGFYEGLVNAALLAGIIFYLTSWMIKIWKPEWPNYFYGYRTPRSLKTKETFDAGNEYSFALMRKISIGLMIIGILIAVFYHRDIAQIFLIIALASVLISTFYLIASTENYLKKNFPDKN